MPEIDAVDPACVAATIPATVATAEDERTDDPSVYVTVADAIV
jgi:hypothetical protein